MPQTVTFVGVGAIGLPMAARIAAGGHTVTCVDPLPAAAHRATRAGLAVVSDIGAAPPADVVVVMVATPEQLAGVVDRALEIINLPGTRWVLMSTVGPDSVRAQAARLAAAGALVVDAPVTGGVTRARTGDLTLFAAGDAQAIEAVAPLLAHIGTVRAVGTTVGDGQAVKVVNQHLCSVHLAAAAEALALAGRLGLDPATVLGLVGDGAAGSWMLNDRGPRMLAGTDVPVSSAMGIFVKDSELVSGAARSSGASTPLLDEATAAYRAAADAGLLHKDDSRVIEIYT